MDLQTYKSGIKIPISSASIKFPCSGTHGITYVKTNNRIYVECSGCGSPNTNSTKCPTAHWEVDYTRRNVTRRLVSPYLSSTYASIGGQDLGIMGKPTASPEESLVLSTNGAHKIVHIYRPTASGIDITEAIIPGGVCSPGNIAFYSKDSTTEFGSDPNPANYFAVILLG